MNNDQIKECLEKLTELIEGLMKRIEKLERQPTLYKGKDKLK